VQRSWSQAHWLIEDTAQPPRSAEPAKHSTPQRRLLPSRAAALLLADLAAVGELYEVFAFLLLRVACVNISSSPSLSMSSRLSMSLGDFESLYSERALLTVL
jgi:hypothetical protein